MRGEVIVFDPSMAGRVYNGSYVSEDSGHTWRVLDDQKKVLAVSPEDPDLLFAGTGLYNELYRSTDRGLTWTTLFTLEWQVYYFRDVEFDPSDATRVLVAVQSSVGASLQGISGRVYESHDGGESFSIVLEGVYPGVDPSELANPELARNAAVEPKQIVFDGDDVFMPCSGGLLRYDGQDFARLTFDYSQGVCIAADGAVYLLIQKGFEEPPDWIPVYNTAGLLSEINVLYRSENRGQDLEAVSAFEGAFGLSVDPTDAQRLYANGAGLTRVSKTFRSTISLGIPESLNVSSPRRAWGFM